MTTRYFSLAITLLLLYGSAAATRTQNGSGEKDGYTLVWQDLFDGDQINTQRWNIEVNGDGGGNAELQYYTDRKENVRVARDSEGNGCLILTAKRENYQGKNFTSGRINSKNKIAFTHGKLEASIKIDPTANGLWPAFWTMGNDFDAVGWPQCGETDIMEFGHANGISQGLQDRFFNGASHWGVDWDHKGDYARDHTCHYSLQDGQFHLYTMIWDENTIRMYVDLDRYPDNLPYYEINIARTDTNDDLCAGNFFHKDNFIIFNLAVGGNFPAIHNASGISALNDTNGQQASMYVDYVKIYQKGLSSESKSFADAGDMNPGSGNGDITENPVPTDRQIYDILQMDDSTVENLLKSGNTVNDLRPDNQTTFLHIWSNTYNRHNTSLVGFAGVNYEYVCLDVTNIGWSGAGYFISRQNVDLSHISENTRLHIAYRSEGPKPSSVGFSLWTPAGFPARFAIGSDFIDNDSVHKSVGPPPESEWNSIEITLSQIAALNPGFSYKDLAVNNFCATGGHNILSFLCGSNTGDNIALDHIYLISPMINTGIAIPEISEQTIEYYNLQGLRVENPSQGIYIRRCGNKTDKVIL